MNFSLHNFFLILYIFFKLIFPQINKIFFKASSNDSCTRITREYNSDRYFANARLNYYKSQGWDTSALRDEIARIRDDFEYNGNKNGCKEIESKEKDIEYSREQYYKY